ncbi:MAG: ABC transporter ATP-binding protein [Myxococcota bacterium]
MSTPLLRVRGLATSFHTDEGVTEAVRALDLTLHPGRTLGLVGESGSGKSVTSLALMGLLPERIARLRADEIRFGQRDLMSVSESERRGLRGKELAMIFQEPGTALNPVHRVGDQVIEAILAHEDVSRDEAEARAVTLFEEVGIPEPRTRLRHYPHELSGGQKQRVMIAMALSCNPRLLIADEPTTALDVTIQAQILDLFRRLRDERQMAMLFITHDLGVIAEIADEVAVMYRGDLVEVGDVRRIFEAPQHPYTKGLLACRPRLDMQWRRLPTVDDFMVVEDGEIREREKPLQTEGAYRSETAPEDGRRLGLDRGRGRLLDRAADLEAQGFAIDALNLGEDDSLVDASATPLLSVKDLVVRYPKERHWYGRTKTWLHAVDGVSFHLYRGQTLGLVGESGCGKTTTGRAILRLQEAHEGSVHYDGLSVFDLRGADLRRWRRRVQIVFQDPYGSLNPRMSVCAALTEAMAIHQLGGGPAQRLERAGTLLEEVGLKGDYLKRYPHEFSGGQRQRIGIARALAVEPELIVCDESVSALDVSVQAQVLNLLKDLQEARGLSYLFISHDLSVVKFMADMMVVMNKGKIVEAGPSDAIYRAPKEDYTKRLIAAIPDDSLANIERRQAERTRESG